MGLADFLAQEQDMKELFQVVHALPLQRSEMRGDFEISLAVETIELGISLIQSLGNAVAAHEAGVGETNRIQVDALQTCSGFCGCHTTHHRSLV